MWCDGGYDDNGCKRPESCMPTKEGEYEKDIYQIFLNIFVLFIISLTFYGLLGPLDNNGYECPVSCPMNCPMKDMISCPGGDDGNGCMMQDFCIASIGKF